MNTGFNEKRQLVSLGKTVAGSPKCLEKLEKVRQAKY